ncbi:prepilin-type N-terminal cleavage/methylation domain-containing protein [Halomonas daqingensis]|uniref:Prepilin-type N-terminal cleavage/methylation domain-containing protein n=1 Tax=Billgrantia desiderata TaxID=52021 RepID=A0AAW4YYN7_9GAMM|nr:prepilin-type N-terminal cleavage/methylation domain-containing protein [Halomonas desiderata]MCE8053691.1 prepilin-type N-terminal cleavage/methylation domain-containing protein [Halomonas desiderata]
MKIKKNGYICLRNAVAYRQTGFTLVELMVALVIGLIIILGAGQLFLMGFQTFRQIELLSNKQAALTFATETLIRDIRRATDVDFDNGALTVAFTNNSDMSGCSGTVVRVYRLSQAAISANEGWSLNMGQECESAPSNAVFEPLVTAFNEDGFFAEEIDDGVWEISFQLMAGRNDETDSFTFNAVNRNQAIE